MSILKGGDKGNITSKRLDQVCNSQSNFIVRSSLNKSSSKSVTKPKRSATAVIVLATIVAFAGLGIDYTSTNLAYGQNLDAQQYNSHIQEDYVEQTTYTYYIIPPISVSDRTQIVATHQAFESWESLNPSLNFIHVDYYNADIVVKWTKFVQNENLGLFSCNFMNCEIVIALGDRDCNNRHVRFDSDTLTNTMMYLIGRMLDIGHTNDNSHLMYGIKDPTPQRHLMI